MRCDSKFASRFYNKVEVPSVEEQTYHQLPFSAKEKDLNSKADNKRSTIKGNHKRLKYLDTRKIQDSLVSHPPVLNVYVNSKDLESERRNTSPVELKEKGQRDINNVYSSLENQPLDNRTYEALKPRHL
ncbi:uncharacterized protein LOC106060422 isoform X2 [Biomphalaria glabrata]|uniref:Uncharacterized protein LOC106060422 isoform X2 n=1 Tax=Biomphalaria glabrata TaxID=6526 RepID=A0A9W3ABL6_BIOGL|nr:uncharacterized protein LOC106060422 isoform X2 [Biomphalaria glabrata]